jgi:uncharacterized membrane protein
MATEMRPTNESRWHGPAVYWTVVASFLLASVVMLVSYFAYEKEFNPPPNYGLASLQFPALVFVTSIFAIPSIFGAIKLYNRRKNAIYVSIFALALWTIAHFLLIFDKVPYRFDLNHDMLWMILFSLDLIMIAFVIKGWKTMFNKTSSV